jgi:cytochrome c
LRVGVLIGSAGLLFGLACAFGLVHPYGNLRSASGEPRSMLLKDAQIPEAAKSVLRDKCADCHSEATHWPRYARMAPVSWLIERDAAEGRAHMDLSQWGRFSRDRQAVLVQQLALVARQNRMPPIQYRLVHWEAALTPADRFALKSLAPDESGGTTATAGDAATGKAVFERKCTGCHALDADREGPHLRGVFGRKAGSVPGFDYSEALKNSRIVWQEENLDRWLRDTDAAVPNNNMGFSVPNAQDRADLIAFLRTLH